jgi:hypothetical protein
MMSKKYTSKPIRLTPAIRQAAFKHALLLFHKVDHSGASYEARIFFNNSSAIESTPRTLECGYAGKFNIFGHGRCWGDEGHCMVQSERRLFDNRSPHPLTPREVTINVTQALRKAAIEGDKLVITVVPVVRASASRTDAKDCFHFDGLSLKIRSSHGLLEDPNSPEAPPLIPLTEPPGGPPLPAKRAPQHRKGKSSASK